MTVKELIAELEKLDPELEVIVPDDHGGCYPRSCSGLVQYELAFNAGTDWIGAYHQIVNGIPDVKTRFPRCKYVKAVALTF